MLKLEKTSKTSGPTLRFRDRDRFFEPQLLKAMGIALMLHIGGLILFHVSPFTISSTFVFPPIEVQSDQPIEGATTLLTFHEKDEEDIPPPPLRLVPSMDWTGLPTESKLMPEIALNINALDSLEERVWPIWQPSPSVDLKGPLIKLTISGNLAEQKVIRSDPMLDKMVSLNVKSLSHVYVTYHVQLDERKGELFWHERIQSSGVEDVDRLTEKILLNLKFTTPTPREPVEGTLNFAVVVEESKL